MSPATHGREYSQAVRRLNDSFRTTTLGGRIMMTSGIRERGRTFERLALQAVVLFDGFTPDNDPHGEHDFGSFEVEGQRCFWKIDYYDHTLEGGSENPADPAVTTRVLTIMLTREY